MQKQKSGPNDVWSRYERGDFFDELVNSSGDARQHSKQLANYLANLSTEERADAQTVAELAIKEMGITFTVYGEGSSIDRSWPIDIVPRIIAAKEWKQVEKGLIQRVQALNMFIDDLYHEQNIVKDGIFPKELIDKSVNFRPQCVGISPPNKIWAHICGSDLVRDKDGTMYVLEDNLRVPSGVSYMLENRSVIKRIFPELFDEPTSFSCACVPVLEQLCDHDIC